MRAASDRQHGFTLIEIMVALAILGVVALLAYRATAAMTDGEARLSAESERWRTLDRVFARLEADMREAIPRSVRRGTTVDPAWSAEAGDGDGNTDVAFTRAGPEFSAEPGAAGQRIGYRLRERTLEVVYWPQLDNVDDARATAYALMSGVTRFRVRQLGTGTAWLPRWPLAGDPAGLPRAVDVELELADGTQIDRVFVLR